MNDVPYGTASCPVREQPQTPKAPLYRSVFISDVHLGTKGSNAEMLNAFLRRCHLRQLYLVGDIIDGWRLRGAWFWHRHHDAVLRTILRHARNGTEVVYIPGNHDEMLRAWLPIGLHIGGVRLAEDAVHETADGKRLLVIHGDAFDSVVRYAKFLALLGDYAYTVALVANRWFNSARRHFGYPYWTLSAWLKLKVKEAVKFIDNFEVALADEARRRGIDGVICGHIHHAEMRMIGGVRYSTAATGWRAAPPSSSILTAGSS